MLTAPADVRQKAPITIANELTCSNTLFKQPIPWEETSQSQCTFMLQRRSQLNGYPIMRRRIENTSDSKGGLLSASERGALSRCAQLVSDGANVNGRQDGICALHHAVANNHTELVRMLLENGALADSPIGSEEGECRASTDDGDELPVWYPVHYAIQHGSIEVVRLLLRHGAALNGAIGSGNLVWPPLHYAVYSIKPHIVRLLLDAHADANTRFAVDTRAGRFLWTPLHLACNSGDATTVRLLLNSRASTSVRISACARKLACVASKLPTERSGASVHADYTALHLACAEGYAAVANELVAHGADVNAPTVDGTTPLHLACARRSAALVQLLLESGASVHASRWDADSSPHSRHPYALQRALPTTINGELPAPLPPRHVLEPAEGVALMWPGTALHTAAWANSEELARLLLKWRADVDQPADDFERMTPLHVAAMHGHASMIGVLIAAGARWAAKALDGKTTALALAARHGQAEAVAVLLQHLEGLSVTAVSKAELELAISAASSSGMAATLRFRRPSTMAPCCLHPTSPPAHFWNHFSARSVRAVFPTAWLAPHEHDGATCAGCT